MRELTAAAFDLAFEHKVKRHSGGRRHDHRQEVKAWVWLGCEHRWLGIDRNFEGKMAAAEVVCEFAGSGSKSRQCCKKDSDRIHEEG